MQMTKLTDKQEMFCHEYLIDLNATQAAIRVGYSEKTAYSQGQRLLKNVECHELIEKLKAEREEATGIDAEWVLKSAKKVFDRCMQYEPILDRKGEPVLTTTENGEFAAAYKFDSSGANKALELVGKHISVQAFKERIEQSGEIDINVSDKSKRRNRIAELLSKKK